MTKEDFARNQARMRCENTERLRVELWAKLERDLRRGSITEERAALEKRRFWQDRTRDELAARGVLYQYMETT